MKLRHSVACLLLLAITTVLAAQSRPKAVDAPPVVPPLPSDPLFDDTVVHDIYLTVNSRDWQSLKDHYLDNTYYPANFKWRDQTFRNVGIRSRGHASRSPIKPSLRVDFNRYVTDGEFLGLTALVLRNNSQDASSGMHERISMLLFNRMGAPFAREAHARLFINNEFSGLYSLVEEPDGKMAQRLFNESAGNVYEFTYNPGDPPYYLEDRGPDPAQYVPAPFEPKTHESDPHAEVIEEFIRTLNDSDGVFRSLMPNYVDFTNLIRHIALEMVIGDLDGFHGQFAVTNFDVYRLAHTKLLMFMPWDKSGAFAGEPTLTIWHDLLDVPAEKRNRLTMRVLGFADLKSQLLDTLVATANSTIQLDPLNPLDTRGWMEREIEREYQQISDFAAVAPEDLALYSKAQFEQEVARLRDFARRRADFVRAEVAAAR
jgi:spore coat protein CotH